MLTAQSNVLQLGLCIKSHNTENFVSTFFLFFFLLNSFFQEEFWASLEMGNVWDDFPYYQKALIWLTFFSSTNTATESVRFQKHQSGGAVSYGCIRMASTQLCCGLHTSSGSKWQLQPGHVSNAASSGKQAARCFSHLWKLFSDSRTGLQGACHLTCFWQRPH